MLLCMLLNVSPRSLIFLLSLECSPSEGQVTPQAGWFSRSWLYREEQLAGCQFPLTDMGLLSLCRNFVPLPCLLGGTNH